MSSSVPSSSQPRLLYVPRQNRRSYGDASSASLAPSSHRNDAEATSASHSSSHPVPSASRVNNAASASTNSSAKKPSARAQRTHHERFHGAFSGGFSAGYYNTVGSKEGWEPTNYGTSTQSRKEGRGNDVPHQSIQSFMDEQDHNEWGGPSGVRNEFLSHHVGGAQEVGAKEASTLFTIQVRSGIGDRLLRALGWRGSSASSAYVPVHKGVSRNDDNAPDGSVEELSHQSQSVLASKRLRRIEMNQVHVNIPKPKVDVCGLGYEPFREAPEFARHVQARQKRAELQATGAGRRPIHLDAYDDAYDGNGDDRVPTRSRPPKSSLPTYQPEDEFRDFVGSRSVGGFALMDDEDDAYDDGSHGTGGRWANPEEFDSELDLNDEADQDRTVENARFNGVMRRENRQSTSKERAVEGLFSSWATASARPGADAATAAGEATVTSDGRPLLPGFVLVATATSSSKRYRGPDVPADVEVQPHAFEAREHPLIYQALLHADRLQNEEDKYQSTVNEALHLNSVIPTAPNATFVSHQQVPHDGARKKASFLGVSKAMASRFTSASSIQASPASDSGEVRTAHDAAATARGRVRRTYSTFVPSALLCKRLGVSVPRNRESMVIPEAGRARTKEESFFQDEILSRLAVPRDQLESSNTRSQNKMSDGATGLDQERLAGAMNCKIPTDPPRDDRPPEALYKSIFEPREDDVDKEPAGWTNTQERNTAEDRPVDIGRSLDSVDKELKYREVGHPQQGSIDDSRDNESESTGISGISPRRSKKRKDRKQKLKKPRKKRKDKKRKRDH